MEGASSNAPSNNISHDAISNQPPLLNEDSNIQAITNPNTAGGVQQMLNNQHVGLVNESNSADSGSAVSNRNIMQSNRDGMDREGTMM